VALYSGRNLLRGTSLHHDVQEFEGRTLIGQLPARMKSVQEFVKGETRVDAAVGRGGLLHPLKSGAYAVNDDMLQDLESSRYGVHASNLGAFMAKACAEMFSPLIPPIVVDPVVVDEMEDRSRISGIPDIERRSVFHALNQKAVARRVAATLGKKYEETRLVVAHMGGGITVGVHRYGQVVDVNNGLDGDGPMSPERAGLLPATQLVDLCFSGKYTLAEMERRIVGGGGFVAHLGTNDCRVVEKQALPGTRQELLMDALVYQVSKEIGRGLAALGGKVDAIVLTGGLARSEVICSGIRQRVSKFGMVVLHPGEDELSALAEGAIRVLTGEDEPQVYQRWPE
jgi:butyrate kinase